MGSRGGGTRVQGLKMVKAAPGRQLIDAAFAGNQQAVVRLLKAGKIVGGSNYQDERGRTALMAAAEGGHGGVVNAEMVRGHTGRARARTSGAKVVQDGDGGGAARAGRPVHVQ